MFDKPEYATLVLSSCDDIRIFLEKQDNPEGLPEDHGAVVYRMNHAMDVWKAAISCAQRVNVPVRLQFFKTHVESFSASTTILLNMQRAKEALNACLKDIYLEQLVFEFTRCGVAEERASEAAQAIANIITPAAIGLGW